MIVNSETQASVIKSDSLGVYFNSGTIYGSYLGASAGKFNGASTVNGGVEILTSSKASIAFNGSVSLDPETAIYRYLYAGVSNRFYLGAPTTRISFQDHGSKIEITPHTQYYIGVESGISQIVIDQRSDSLSVLSTVFEYGLSLGFIWPMTNGVGLSGSVVTSKGVGISAVAVDSTISKTMIGLIIR